ncbi:MAG: hypothetical protein U1B30_07785 [Pseudomonadota bacterium]|nr:hypothetical protein [Pseudomonadota bacterium]
MNKNLLEIGKLSDQSHSENNDVTREVNQLTGLPQEQQRIAGQLTLERVSQG